MCDLRASVPPAVRGSGISLRFSYLVARRRSILPPLSSSSLPACFAVSPCRSHPRPLPHVLRSCPLRLFLSCVLVWFLIALLPVLATSRAGRYLLVCLIRFRFSLSRPVLPPLRCLSRLVSPCLLAPRGSFLIVLFVPPFSSHAAACPCLFAFARVSLPPVRLVSPSCDKRGRGAYRLVLACLSLSSGAFSSHGRLAVSAG